MFGDHQAYTDKFKTCARARPIHEQILGETFYKKEKTKPLFEKHGILALQNLYTYHCFMETFKILKFHSPTGIYSLYKTSGRDNTKGLITPEPSAHFLYKSSSIWNSIRPKMKIQQHDMSTSISQTKSSLKKGLLYNQHQHHKTSWLPPLDFNHEKLQKSP